MLGLIYYLFPLLLVAQEKKGKYLDNNHAIIFKEENSDTTLVQLLENGSLDYKLFVIGEYHDVNPKGTLSIKFKLFKYLYYNAGVRVFLTEEGYGESILINKYLETGDKLILSKFSLTKHEDIFYSNLYLFYQSLEKSDKFIVAGIDHEDNINLTADAIKLLLYNKTFPEKLKNVLLPIVMRDYNIIHLRDDDRYDLLDNLVSSFERDNEIYKDFLGGKFTAFEMTLAAYEKYLKWRKVYFPSGDKAELDLREQFLYENLVKIVNQYPMSNYFGQFGNLHTPIAFQSEYGLIENWLSFSARANANADSPLKNKVCSYLMMYDCINKNKYYKKAMGLSDDLICSVKELSTKKRITLFKLDNINSPYKDIVKNKFQYIIMNRL